MNIDRYKELKHYLSIIDFNAPHTFHELYVFYIKDYDAIGLRRFSRFCQAMGVSYDVRKINGRSVRCLKYNAVDDSEALKQFTFTEQCPNCHGRGVVMVTGLTPTDVVE